MRSAKKSIGKKRIVICSAAGKGRFSSTRGWALQISARSRRKLTFLPITVAATHAHWDHIGGHKYFAEFAVHETEKEWLSGSFPLPLEAVKKNLLRGRCSFPKEFDIDRYEIFQGEPKRLLHDGDSFELGNRLVEVVHTPGHSPGHCCFYEAERRYLYAGDLVYRGCLDAFYPTTDPRAFLRSLKKLEKLEIDKLLPAHHGLPVSARHNRTGGVRL